MNCGNEEFQVPLDSGIHQRDLDLIRIARVLLIWWNFTANVSLTALCLSTFNPV